MATVVFYGVFLATAMGLALGLFYGLKAVKLI